jgi:hypothetical protein
LVLHENLTPNDWLTWQACALRTKKNRSLRCGFMSSKKPRTFRRFLERLDRGGLLALGTHLDFEADLLAFLQRLESA